MALDVTSYLLGKKNAGGGGGSSIDGQKIFTFEGDQTWLMTGSGIIEGTENIQKLNEIAELLNEGKCPHIAITLGDIKIWLHYNYTSTYIEENDKEFITESIVNLGETFGVFTVNFFYYSSSGHGDIRFAPFG